MIAVKQMDTSCHLLDRIPLMDNPTSMRHAACDIELTAG